MAKTIRLKESDLNRIIKSIVREGNRSGLLLEKKFKWGKLFGMILKAAVSAIIGSLFSKRPPSGGDIRAIDDFVARLATARNEPDYPGDTPALLELEEQILKIRDMANQAVEGGGRGESLMERRLLSEGWIAAIGRWFKNRWDDLVQEVEDQWFESARPGGETGGAVRGETMNENYRRDMIRKHRKFKTAQKIYETRTRARRF